MESGSQYVIKKTSFVLIFGLFVCLLISGFSLHIATKQKQFEQKQITTEFLSHLSRRIDHNLAIFSSINSLFLASGYVNRAEFSIFSRPFFSDRPALMSVQWSPKVKASDKALFIDLAAKEGMLDFSFKQRGYDHVIQPATEREEYYPAFYVEPFTGNYNLLGVDLVAGGEHRASLELASSTQTMVAFTPIGQQQSHSATINSLIIAKPIFLNASLAGFVSGLFDINVLFDLSNNTAYSGLKVSLYTPIVPNNYLVYDSSGTTQISETPPLGTYLPINVANQTWYLSVSFPYQDSYQYLTTPIIVFLISVFIACLVAYAYMQTISREVYAKRLADVREQKVEMLHKQLDEHRAELFEAEKNASITGLMSCLTHELKTPIGIINTTISMQEELSKEIMQRLKNDALTASFLKEYNHRNFEAIKLIQSNNNRAINLVESYQSVAIDQTHADLRIFKVKKYTEEVLFTLKPKLKLTKHQVQLNCDDKLTVKSYPGAYAQILVNLINNSLLHGFDGINEGIISIDINKMGDMVRLVYADNGVGMPKENLDKIWSSKFSTKKGRGGTGLGMSIVYNLITNVMNGQVSCTSKLGEGIKFVIDFKAES